MTSAGTEDRQSIRSERGFGVRALIGRAGTADQRVERRWPPRHTRPWYLIPGLVSAALPAAVVFTAPAASAECVDAGGTTVCAQGTVRGGGPDAPSAGPWEPYPCEYDWYCDDGDDLITDPGPPGGSIDTGRPDRPGGGGDRPGGGGGIGPR